VEHPSEPVIYREEAVGTMWTLTDILVELRGLRDDLRNDGEEAEEED
jgi:hypothetical protein